MVKSCVLSFSLCILLVLFHGCVAKRQQQQHQQQKQQNECQIQNLEALEPSNRIKSEAGLTEIWDHNNEQFQCAGVAVIRHTIQPQGLHLPSFTSAPQLMYIVKGRGILGLLISGCPETYQSAGQQQSQQGQGQREGQEQGKEQEQGQEQGKEQEQGQEQGKEQEQGQEQGRRGRQEQQDQHQKIRHFREGDIIALPAGAAYWTYNDGNNPIQSVILLDTSNNANQLDQNPRRFYLAGNPQQEHQQSQQGQQGRGEQRQQGQKGRGEQGQESSGTNIFSGFDTKILAEAFGVNRETARKLQSQNDNRGNIIKVEGGIQIIRPPQSQREEREQQGERDNGMEETLCSMRLRENIGDPSRADIFTPQAGRISTLNSNNLPILNWLKLSAERGVLYRNAIYAPHYNLNAHGITYVTKGSARVQIVDENGQAVFDDQIKEGQILVQPQNFGILKQAGNEGFEYITFKTNDNAMINTLAGRISAIRAMPIDVLTNIYQISREDALKLKFNREQTTLFSQRSSSERRDVA